jgi:hypothetical protein
MNLRAIILLGWKESDKAGPPAVENLYTGHDGVALAEIHTAAQKSGDYIAFRKIINPYGIPMPMTIDPAPKPPVFPKAESAAHEPDLQKRLKAAEVKQNEMKLEPKAGQSKVKKTA